MSWKTGPVINVLVLALGLPSLAPLAAFAQESSAAEKKVDSDVKELSGISIIGNKEAPKSLYIVPWKSSEVGVESELVSSLMDDKLQPLDKEVFSRELEFYRLSLSED
ncbi:hypothetical protein AUP74_01639 [Microbulbifer aggregans]|uniref:Uncharacterized protein n=1 Tax=Microbulbifer aggregans TaxID=1769779 RepID=A0A1C9W7E7_9GAMM|nr:hypothetical protein [Microbulbifer aggregans]AOS97072.1 hypothetical protein AUP74_01639 [Microbulbifer aggregans]